MKNVAKIFMAFMAMINVAQACGSGSVCEGTMLVLWPTLIITGAPLGTTSNLVMNNDLVQVRDSAAMAKETGVISNELESVIAKIRAEGNAATASASNAEIINSILEGLNSNLK